MLNNIKKVGVEHGQEENQALSQIVEITVALSLEKGVSLSDLTLALRNKDLNDRLGKRSGIYPDGVKPTRIVASSYYSNPI